MRVGRRNFDVTWIDWVALALVIVGALNWGIVGIGGLLGQEWNLVTMLLGWAPLLENLVYLLVGIAGLYVLYFSWQLAAVESEFETDRTDTPT